MMTTHTKHIPESLAENALERAVLDWLNRKGADGYESGAAGAARDLFYGGCSSGIVNDLIYHDDCLAFARLHLADILEAIERVEDETGESLRPAKGESMTPDWLAWTGFELAARAVCDRAGIE